MGFDFVQRRRSVFGDAIYLRSVEDSEESLNYSYDFFRICSLYQRIFYLEDGKVDVHAKSLSKKINIYTQNLSEIYVGDSFVPIRPQHSFLL